MTDTQHEIINQQPGLPELEELAMEIGKFIRYWGFKKIHGRIWAHIYLSKVPLDAGALMARLKVSKALMSLSLNDLLKYRVILESGKSERGTHTYVANPQVLDVILNVLHRREKKMLAHIEMAHRMLKSASPTARDHMNISGDRLENLGAMIHEAQATLNAILELSNFDMKNWMQVNAPN
jgi:DNA-binding transcriptional regulator GbsR (MarR family)